MSHSPSGRMAHLTYPMNQKATQLASVLLSALFLFPLLTLAETEETYVLQGISPNPTAERFTNANWHVIPHPEVASFTMHADGSSDGMTVTGVPFTQYNVANDAGIRVQRFEIQDHYHYIVEGEIIETFEELSARLALAFEANQS